MNIEERNTPFYMVSSMNKFIENRNSLMNFFLERPFESFTHIEISNIIGMIPATTKNNLRRLLIDGLLEVGKPKKISNFANKSITYHLKIKNKLMYELNKIIRRK